MNIIFHIAAANDWKTAQSVGAYQTDSLESEGFIHCSKSDQLIGVADCHFRGQENLILLVIDAAVVDFEIRYENLDGGDNLFPHIYGPLNLDAIIRICDFQPQPDGSFSMTDCSI